MTVSTSYTPLTYVGNGVTTSFAVSWTFDAAADLVVKERTIATGAETTKTLTTDYTVSGGSGSTGTVTAVTAPAATVQWVISRSTTRSQATDYGANDPFPADTHENALDKLTRIDQEQDGDLAKALQFPGTDSTSLSAILPSSVTRANKLLSFSAAGEPTAVAAADVSLTTVSTFINTLLDDVDADTALATLTAAGTGLANTFTKTQTWTKGADVASATTLTLGDGNSFDVTGTTAITAIATKGAGTVIKLHFDAALTLTHHATDLILPGGANITTAAGDEAEFVEYATGDWRCTNYTKASGRAVVEASPDIDYDGTAGRVLRQLQVIIENGTNANTIKVQAAVPGGGNATAISQEDNLGKSGDTGNFALNAGGNVLTIQASGLDGNAIAATALTFSRNATGTAMNATFTRSGNDLLLGFRNAASDATIDLTAAVDSGDPVHVYVTYLTDA